MLLDTLSLVLHAVTVLLLLRGVQALERLASPPEQEEDGPFDYYAAEQEGGKGRGQSDLYRRNRDLNLPT